MDGKIFSGIDIFPGKIRWYISEEQYETASNTAYQIPHSMKKNIGI